jgi:hypothetical protein
MHPRRSRANPIKKKARFLECASWRRVHACGARGFFYTPSAACSFSPTQNAIFRSASDERERNGDAGKLILVVAGEQRRNWLMGQCARGRETILCTLAHKLFMTKSEQCGGRQIRKMHPSRERLAVFLFFRLLRREFLPSMNKLSAWKLIFPCKWYAGRCVAVKI